MKKKKILIVGSSANTYSIAKYFAKTKNEFEIFVVPGNDIVSKFATRIDIRESDISELLKFAITNDINLTVVTSKEAIKNDIAGDFRENSQLIFAPEAKCANFATSRAYAKKFLYKLQIKCPKFGIFDKAQFAYEYAKNAQYPLLITTDNDNENSVRAVCSSIQHAQTCINDIFGQGDDIVVMEEYIYGHPFTLYIITDGYQALPICAVGDYKFLEDGDGGIYSKGCGAFAPDYKVPLEIIDRIINKDVSLIIKSLQKQGKQYVGILGIEAVLKSDNTYIITGFAPFFKEHDTDIILSILDTNLYNLMKSCANDSFSDEYDEIPTNSMSAVSCIISSRFSGSIISGLDEDDDEYSIISHFGTKRNKYFEYLTNKGRTISVTQSAATLSRARTLLYENINNIKFEGRKYRKDICAI